MGKNRKDALFFIPFFIPPIIASHLSAGRTSLSKSSSLLLILVLIQHFNVILKPFDPSLQISLLILQDHHTIGKTRVLILQNRQTILEGRVVPLALLIVRSAIENLLKEHRNGCTSRLIEGGDSAGHCYKTMRGKRRSFLIHSK